MSNTGKTFKKRYTLLSVIGKGGWGTVYKGLDLTTGALVALKELNCNGISKDARESMRDEVSLLEKLNHPNIVPYIDSFQEGDYFFIVLEYIESGSLSGIAKEAGRFPEQLIVIFISQVLDGLLYLHDQGVVHRDIKGANILATKRGVVKLADFGVAEVVASSDMIGDGENVQGSPYWMAPEVIELNGVSSKADIWSLGCTIIELLTGQPPYYELDQIGALFRIVQDDYPPLPEGISDQCRSFLRQCFQKEPLLRLSAKELLEHQWIKDNSLQTDPIEGAVRDPLKRRISRAFLQNQVRVTSAGGDIGMEGIHRIAEGKDGGENADAGDNGDDVDGENNTVEGDGEDLRTQVAAFNLQRKEAEQAMKAQIRFETLTRRRKRPHLPLPEFFASVLSSDSGGVSSSSSRSQKKKSKKGKEKRQKSHALARALRKGGGGSNKKRNSRMKNREKLDVSLKDQEKHQQKEKDKEKEKEKEKDKDKIGKHKRSHSSAISFSSLSNSLSSALSPRHHSAPKKEDGRTAPYKIVASEETEWDFEVEPLIMSVDEISTLSSDFISSTANTDSSSEGGGEPDGSSEGEGEWGNIVEQIKAREGSHSTKDVDIETNGNHGSDGEQGEMSPIVSKSDTSPTKSNVADKETSTQDIEDVHQLDLEANLRKNLLQQVHQRLTRLFHELRCSLSLPKGIDLKPNPLLVDTSKSLINAFREYPDQKLPVVRKGGVSVLLELLDVQGQEALEVVFTLVFEIAEYEKEIQESLLMFGIIPKIISFWGPMTCQNKQKTLFFPLAIRLYSVRLFQELLQTSGVDTVLRTFMSGRCLGTVVDLFHASYHHEDYTTHRQLVLFALDLLHLIIDTTLGPSSNTRDLCRVWSRAGLLPHLVRIFIHVNQDNTEVPSIVPSDAEIPLSNQVSSDMKVQRNVSTRGATVAKVSTLYPRKVADVLYTFVSSDDMVRDEFTSEEVLVVLFSALESVKSDVLLVVLQTIRDLSKASRSLEALHRAGGLASLIHLLDKYGLPSNRRGSSPSSPSTVIFSPKDEDGSFVSHGDIVESRRASKSSRKRRFKESHLSCVFQALYNLCRLVQARQEEACRLGLVRHLKAVIESESPSKQFALPMFCELARSRKCHPFMWDSNGIPFLIGMFSEPFPWQIQAFDSLVAWMSCETDRVVANTIPFTKQLARLFCDCEGEAFVRLVEPFLKLLQICFGATSDQSNLSKVTTSLSPPQSPKSTSVKASPPKPHPTSNPKPIQSVSSPTSNARSIPSGGRSKDVTLLDAIVSEPRFTAHILAELRSHRNALVRVTLIKMLTLFHEAHSLQNAFFVGEGSTSQSNLFDISNIIEQLNVVIANDDAVLVAEMASRLVTSLAKDC